MTIGESIKQLLEERKRVILPGFGNLEIKESAGGIPSSSARIDPPGLTIRFDSSFSKDDGLLSNAWSLFGGVSKEEAEQQVLELVDAIRFALDKGETYLLTGAGIFSRDDEGKVYFQPGSSWILDEDQYGLGSMELLELEDLPVDEAETMDLTRVSEEAEKESQAEPNRGPILELSEEEETDEEEELHPDSSVQGSSGQDASHEENRAPEESAPKPVAKLVTNQSPKPLSRRISQPKGPMENQESRKRTGLWRVIWILAGILIIVLVVLLILPSDSSDSEAAAGGQVQPQQQVTDQATQAEEQPAQVPELTDEDLTAPEEMITIEGDVNHFFLIAGSFRNLANASELQDKLNAKGYDAEVMITENRMYRVSVGSYPTSREAERRLLSLKNEEGMEACWLLSNE